MLKSVIANPAMEEYRVGRTTVRTHLFAEKWPRILRGMTRIKQINRDFFCLKDAKVIRENPFNPVFRVPFAFVLKSVIAIQQWKDIVYAGLKRNPQISNSAIRKYLLNRLTRVFYWK